MVDPIVTTSSTAMLTTQSPRDSVGRVGQNSVRPISSDALIVQGGFGGLGACILIAGIILWAIGATIMPANLPMVLAGQILFGIAAASLACALAIIICNRGVVWC